MLRAVLDTNIHVSGLLFPKGNPRSILARAEAGEFFAYTSPPIQAETDALKNSACHGTKLHSPAASSGGSRGLSNRR
jgi:predicted nucleic acid-binding protein